MNVRSVLIIAALMLLTACGSASDSITFSAPSNFRSKASIGPFMQMWTNGPHSVLLLMALPVKTDLDKALSHADLKDASVKKTQRIKICGGAQDAVFADVEGQANANLEKGQSQRSEIEFLATDVGGKTYMAMYARPLHTAADPAAQAAIKNICPK